MTKLPIKHTVKLTMMGYTCSCGNSYIARANAAKHVEKANEVTA